MSPASIKTRFTISFVANVLRSGLSFFTALLLARRLSPANYGDLAFLLSSFVAIRSLLDMGSSNAFFTFISGRDRGRNYYILYLLWLCLQFGLTSAFILFLSPQSIFERIWLGHSRSIVFLAFVAVFFQQQVWMTITQVAESKRKTLRVQTLNVGIAALHLSAIMLLWQSKWLSISAVLTLITVEYMLATLGAWLWLADLRQQSPNDEAPETPPLSIFGEFIAYCQPLMLLSLSAFLYDFADRWLLQKYAGSRQQGFFQIAYQAAAISLLATTSILNVFWKEIAEAKSSGNLERMQTLYLRINRSAVMFGALLSAFIIPWTPEVVVIVLGPDYLNAVPVLAIMFLYPVHQSMGQIGGTTFLASGQTRLYMFVSVATMVFSLPISYFVQAPPQALLPGLGLGALGLAIKLVGVNIISVNLQAYFLSRHYGWSFDWVYQIVGILLLLGLGYSAKLMAAAVWNPTTLSRSGLLASMVLGGTIYIFLAGTALFLQPWLIGIEKATMYRVARKAFAAFA